MTEVIPAIIPQSLENLKEDIAKVAPFVSLVQIDIMDGKFAPSTSWPFSESQNGMVDALRSNFSQDVRIAFELDMMVEHPETYFDTWSDFGVETFIIHVESTDKLTELIKTLREKGKGVALALKPSTPTQVIENYIEQIDFVQCMGNDKIGYHGVQLDEKVFEKIKDLRNRHKELIISVDIGVNFETAPKLVAAGVNKLVSGSAIFGSNDIGNAIRTLALNV